MLQNMTFDWNRVKNKVERKSAKANGWTSIKMKNQMRNVKDESKSRRRRRYKPCCVWILILRGVNREKRTCHVMPLCIRDACVLCVSGFLMVYARSIGSFHGQIVAGLLNGNAVDNGNIELKRSEAHSGRNRTKMTTTTTKEKKKTGIKRWELETKTERERGRMRQKWKETNCKKNGKNVKKVRRSEMIILYKCWNGCNYKRAIVVICMAQPLEQMCM